MKKTIQNLTGKLSAGRVSLIIVLLLFLTGCLSAGKERIQEVQLDRSYLADIRRFIDKNELFPAYQDISYLEREQCSGIYPAEVEALKKEIIDKIKLDLKSYLEKPDYKMALQYYHSLQQVAPADLPDEWSIHRLLFEQAEQYSSSGNQTLALLFSLRGLTLTTPTESELLRALSFAAEVGNVEVIQDLIKRMEDRGFPVADSRRRQGEDIPPVQKIVRGTVTIWVNRGIKIERGVGFPDRVIGSGFFIDNRGYLLTNYHVIASEVDPKYEGYSRLFIKLSGRADEKIPARVVGYDRIFDIALVKAEVEPDFILSHAASVDLEAGDSIIAIGSPGGLENTVTSGIISATGRRFLQMGDAIQVDVPLNPGNSGGPLLNSAGQLVGIVFAGIEQFEGVNFAIPINWINTILPSLYNEGESIHSWLGVAVQESDKGLEVVYTVPGEPADRAGIKPGDILDTLNNSRYSRVVDFQAALLELDFPSLVALTWPREESRTSGVLSLAPRPFSPVELALERDLRDNVLVPLFGMRIEKVGTFFWKTNYIIKEVLKGSIAEETGLSANDPLNVEGWKVDMDNRFAVLRLFIKKKKSGFLESVIQLAAYLETDTFL
ncbi:hypothetical protein ES705_31337 [subsurface metagenome]